MFLVGKLAARQEVSQFHPPILCIDKQVEQDKESWKFLWNEEIGRDFIELERAFIKVGIKAFSDFGIGHPFILTTDWSKENIKGVLSQVQDGQERVLGCWGRECNKYERNYPSYKYELLAVIQCIKKWKHILS